jgi:hypothetical protein
MTFFTALALAGSADATVVAVPAVDLGDDVDDLSVDEHAPAVTATHKKTRSARKSETLTGEDGGWRRLTAVTHQ